MPISKAHEHIFGMVLMNDWSGECGVLGSLRLSSRQTLCSGWELGIWDIFTGVQMVPWVRY